MDIITVHPLSDAELADTISELGRILEADFPAKMEGFLARFPDTDPAMAGTLRRHMVELTAHRRKLRSYLVAILAGRHSSRVLFEAAPPAIERWLR